MTQHRRTERDFRMNVKSVFGKVLVFCLCFSGVVVRADWESDANTRIEQIRKRDAQITVVDTEGYPVSDINVQIQQTKHHFAFGTCIKNSNLSNSNYATFLRDHFEWGACENETKWEWNESSRDVVYYTDADNTYDWCVSNDIIMRGHCLFWEQTDYDHVQPWVQDLPWATYPTSSELLDEVNERIDGAMAHFDGKFVHWDVDNEMLPTGSGYEFYNRLGETGRVHMFERAHTVDPDCMLFMNEYTGNSFGSYDGWTYRDRANSLIGMGAPIHGLGIQGHINTPFNPQSYYDDVLEPLATVGLPIWVTEFDTNATGSTAANDLENYYRLCFSHASVEGIIMWGFWQDAWRWDGIANTDGTPNAAGIRYETILDEWTTSDTGVTGGSGQETFRGFHGVYEITLSVPGEPAEVHTVELLPGAGTALFELETLLESPGPDMTPPAAPTGLVATAGGGTVTLDWNNNSESDLAGYNVYRSITSGSGYTQVNVSLLSSSDYSDSGLTNGTTYYYVVKAEDFSSNESDPSSEVSGTPQANVIPGRIEAEDYDLGGEGVAYHDTTSGNEGGEYRSDDVDIEVCGEGGYNVGWIASSEWLEYTVDVAGTGTYDIELRVASDSGGGDLHIEFGGVDVTGTVSFSATGGWQDYISVMVNDVSLNAGLQIMHISMDSTYFNINWLEFTGGPGLYGDFTGNGIVDVDDLPGFIGYWLQTDCGDLDLNGDCLINLYEFSELANNWLL